MNNADYWARRFKRMEDAIQDKSYDTYVKNLEKQYDAAIREIDKDMRAWYQRFAENNGISYVNARKWLTTAELDEFKWTVEEYIDKARENSLSGEWVKELENASARVHVSRLDSLKYQLRQQAELLAQAKIKAAANAAELAYTESYWHSAFEAQKGLGVGWTMQGIDSSRLEKVLSRPWTTDNQTFTARCWTDKAKLVETVNQELTRMIATGAAPDKAISAIAKQFNTSKSNAGKLVMTESAYFSSAAQQDCFNELGVEEYRIIGTLDKSMCDLCGGMDGRVFKVSEFKVGATAPPFHPWCRCCTAPYFADMEGVGRRFARDPDDEFTYTVPKDMTYKQWKALQDGNVLDKYEKGGILIGGYNPQDIGRAKRQKGTNFVTTDINNPESIYGENAENIPPKDGFYDIKAHGDSQHVKVFDSVIDAQQLANIIVSRDDYKYGTPIRLLCCDTGKGKNCFAKQLADILGVDVEAPTEEIQTLITGEFKVFTFIGKNQRRYGDMIIFHPKGKE